MNDFTRGPWRQHHLKNYVNILDDKDYCVTSICKLDSNGENDAHLIAAAPEMYEALKALGHILKWLADNKCECDPDVGMEPCETCWHRDLVNKAIAKAEGKQ
jgi:hypothetical protein